ncbi:hypothetical protein [Kaarinaea lacus]
MKNCTDRSRLCRWFDLHWILYLFFAMWLVACGDNTASNPESSSGTNIKNLANDANTASELAAQVECSDLVRFKSIAQLSWRPAENAGDEQRIDVTIFKDGFETGRFESSKALPPDITSYQFDDVKGQALHRWRVVTRTGNDVFFSETARFEGVVCVGDVVVDQPPVPVQ